MLLQDLIRKGPFFLHPFKILQDLARSCEIFRDFAGFFRNLAWILYKTPARFLQNPARSRMILQDLEGMQEKRTFSCKILLEHFYWEGTTVATRLWHFVQGVHNLVELWQPCMMVVKWFSKYCTKLSIPQGNFKATWRVIRTKFNLYIRRVWNIRLCRLNLPSASTVWWIFNKEQWDWQISVPKYGYQQLLECRCHNHNLYTNKLF